MCSCSLSITSESLTVSITQQIKTKEYEGVIIIYLLYYTYKVKDHSYVLHFGLLMEY